MFYKRLFTTPKEKKRTRIKLTHNQKHNIDEAIKLEKVRKVYAKYGYELPK
jgi:hypothetical protein